MAIIDAQGWPQLHARFPSKEDLLLICDLASARAGFSNLSVSATERAGNVRCGVTSPVEGGGKKKVTCNTVLVGFKNVDGGAGGKEVGVTELQAEKLKASAHGPAHKDLSVSLSLDSPDFGVKEGMRIEGWMSLHLLEGCLRTLARKENHFLKRNLTTSKDSCITVGFNCAVGAAKCKFSVRVASLEHSEDEDEVELVIIKISAKHTCRAAASPPSKALLKILDAWPKITLGPQAGAPKPLNPAGPSAFAYAESSSDEDAKTGDVKVDPALRDEYLEVDELDDDAGGKNDLGSQAVHGDILVHSDEAPFGGEDLESAPARKRAKLSPSVEVEEAF